MTDNRTRERALRMVVCWPWHLRGDEPDRLHPIGANCRYCNRDVAQPRCFFNRVPVCLYCALDMNIIPAVEIEPGERLSLALCETVQ